MGYSAGGSSSGSGVVVALGEADMALGGDQGGSIRMPSSWCGIYGMKPTHGLVPYTGIMPIEIFVDHTGPMTKTVNGQRADAGGARRSGRLRSAPVRAEGAEVHRKVLDGGAKGHEDRAWSRKASGGRSRRPRSTPRSGRAPSCSRSSARPSTEVSIPMHLLGPAIWTPIGVEGIAQTMMFGDGYGLSRPDLYVTSLIDKLHGWQLRANELSETTKYLTTLGVYIKKYYGSTLLRQSDEHHAAASRSLRCGAGKTTTCC